MYIYIYIQIQTYIHRLSLMYIYIYIYIWILNAGSLVYEFGFGGLVVLDWTCGIWEWCTSGIWLLGICNIITVGVSVSG